MFVNDLEYRCADTSDAKLLVEIYNSAWLISV